MKVRVVVYKLFYEFNATIFGSIINDNDFVGDFFLIKKMLYFVKHALLQICHLIVARYDN